MKLKSTIGRARWDIRQIEWKIDNEEIKIITLVIELGVNQLLLLIIKVNY